MKRIHPLIGGLVACSIALAMTTSLSAQNVQQGVVKVVNIKGSARYLYGANATWQPLKTGALLKPGAIIQTASGSYVDIVLNNPNAAGIPLSAMTEMASMSSSSSSGPSSNIAYQPKAEQDAVRIFENTVLGIDKLTVDQTGADTVTETQLDLKAGSIFGTVKKLSAASKYEVKIPNGVAGIRGTIYFLSADGVFRVLDGSAVLAYVGSNGTVITQVVTAGQQFDARTGKMSAAPGVTLNEMQRLARVFVLAQPMNYLMLAPDYTLHVVSPTRGM
jgi:hypothetical protein